MVAFVKVLHHIRSVLRRYQGLANSPIRAADWCLPATWWCGWVPRAYMSCESRKRLA